MGMLAAKEGDSVMGTDIHLVKIPTPAGEVPVPMPHPFNGKIDAGLSPDVNIEGNAAAIVGSKASNQVDHIPVGTGFVKSPTNKATLFIGSPTVLINGKSAVRNGDKALTCNDPVDLPMGTVIALPCQVFIA